MNYHKLEPSLLDIQDLDSSVYYDKSHALVKSDPPNFSKLLISGLEESDIYKTDEERALEEMGNVNWIGKLNEYEMARKHRADRSEAEFKVTLDYTYKSPRFSYSIKIRECPSLLGNTQDATTFTSKKPAKHYAAKKALDWLKEHNFMYDENSKMFPNSSGTGQNLEISRDSYAAQVPPLCRKLGLSCPRYVFDQEFPEGPLYNAYADFGNDPRIRSYIGKVRGIYGKKNAKEEVAKLVVEYLTDLKIQKDHRLEEIRKRLN